MRFVKTKNFRINFITSSYSHCMEQPACQCFMIFIRQYFGPESLNTLFIDTTKTPLTYPHNNSKSQKTDWSLQLRVWFGGINFIETNHHFCMENYFFIAFIHYTFLFKVPHPFLLLTVKNVGSRTCLSL